jgi:PRTRC genetic system protein C
MKIEALKRTFAYNAIALADPGAALTPAQVKDFYCAVYPDLTNAEIEGPKVDGSSHAYTFRRAVGTKGSDVLEHAAWVAEGARLFGANPNGWRFKCPSCGHVASVADWRKAGAPENTIGFSCIGRWTGGDDKNSFRKAGGPCTYAGGGLFKINPVQVRVESGAIIQTFAFADAEEAIPA